MKNKILKILGVVLSLALLSSLALVTSPVIAAPGQNVFDDIETPDYSQIADFTSVGIMAVAPATADAPAGIIYAAVVEVGPPWGWTIYKSLDEGFTWVPTTLDVDILGSDEPTDIAISPNYLEDGTFYVSTESANLYRVEDEGEEYPQLLKQAQDSEAEVATSIYDIDLWFDGTEVWILAATDRDVLVMEDSTFAPWLDQELEAPPAWTTAYEVAFAPDFDSSGLIWAVIEDGSGDFLVTSTYSPGQWGWVFDPVELEDQASSTINASQYVDIAFPDFYTASEPVFYVGCTDMSIGLNGNVCLVEIGLTSVGPLTSTCTPLLAEDIDIVSIEVSGETILAGTYMYNPGLGAMGIFRSDNLGDTFEAAIKPPTGDNYFNVYMPASVVWEGETFNPEEGKAYCSTFGYGNDESAFSITEDGGQTWTQISWIDTAWDYIDDLAFSPYTASQPAFIISYDSGTGWTSLWYAADATAASPQWVRIWHTMVTADELYFYGVEYSQDASTVMLYVWNSDASEYQIWKSTDEGVHFSHWRDLPDNAEYISDWVVYDGSTIFCANWNSGGGSLDYGFYGTSRFGPATKALYEVALESIALQPGFDPDDADSKVIVVGGENGDIYISTNGGATWSAAQAALGSSEDVYVAFDADFAVEGAAGEGMIYFATEDGYLGQAAIANGVFAAPATTIPDDRYGVEVDASLEGFSGIWVSPDNTLYVIGGNYDVETLYSYDADGTVYIAGQNAEVDDAIGGEIQIRGDVSGVTYTFTIDLGAAAIENALGVFIDGELLQVIGDSLYASAADTLAAGQIQVRGVSSGATGTIDVPGGTYTGLIADETISVTSSDLMVNLPNTGSFTLTNVALSGVFDAGEDLVVIGYSLTGNGSGTVDGSITVQGVTSGEVAVITVTGVSSGFDDGEVVVVTSSTLDVDETTSSGTVTEDASCFRLLLHEEDNVWENRAIDDAWGIWGTTGSNIVWTVVDGDMLYALKDTLSGPVQNVKVSSISYTTAVVSWDMMTGAKQFEVRCGITDLGVPASPSSTPATTTTLALTQNTSYSVKVRVMEEQAFQSRWSSSVSFTTLQAIEAVINEVPKNGMQDAPLLPSFVWKLQDSKAVSFEFELSTSPDFSTTIVSTTIAAPITAYTCTTELAYDTNHYWRVRAVSNTGTKSDWCFSNFHTRTEEIPPVTIPPQVTPQVTVTMDAPDVIIPDIDITVVPPEITYEVPEVVTVTQNPPATFVLPTDDAGTPVYIWVIVGIGAVLTIAVIVLIIRTRRVV